MQCKGCSKTFCVRPSDAIGRKYCSRACRLEYERVALICAKCSREFQIRRSDAIYGRRKYCSRACRELAHRATLSCPTCGKAFSVQLCDVGRQTYCSYRCSVKSGPESNTWKNGTALTRSGYRRIQFSLLSAEDQTLCE